MHKHIRGFQYSGRDYIIEIFLYTDKSHLSPQLLFFFIIYLVYPPALGNPFCRIYLCKVGATARKRSSQRRIQNIFLYYVHYTTNCNRSLHFKPVNHIQHRSVSHLFHCIRAVDLPVRRAASRTHRTGFYPSHLVPLWSTWTVENMLFPSLFPWKIIQNNSRTIATRHRDHSWTLMIINRSILFIVLLGPNVSETNTRWIQFCNPGLSRTKSPSSA